MKSLNYLFVFVVVLAPHIASMNESICIGQPNNRDPETPSQYTVTASAGENGEVSPGSITVDSGEDASFTATAYSGYEVDTWFLDGVPVQTGGDSFTVSDVEADHTVYVSFKHLGYTISASAGSNGSVYPSEVTVGYNDAATFTATADRGYVVERWYLDGDVYQDGGTSCTVTAIDRDRSLAVTFRKALAYSLDEIDFEDESEFQTRLITNNTIDAEEPQQSMIHVDRVVDVGLDQGGAMVMYNLTDTNPASSNFGHTVNARAKGIFAGTSADRILIQFKYLFASSEPGVELRVYLSDVPELLAHDDPLRAQHYLDVAHIPAPPYPRPGSAGSGRFAVFSEVVWTGHLDLSKGLYIELELIEPTPAGKLPFLSGVSTAGTTLLANSGGSTAYIDNWSPAVQCYGICLDINWDNFVDEADFLTVVGGYGCSASGEMACLDGMLSTDGYVDSYDVVSWDWALNADQSGTGIGLSYCGVPLVSTGSSVGLMNAVPANLLKATEVAVVQPASADIPENISGLLIAGKSGAADARSKLSDKLYLFEADGDWAGTFGLAPDRDNVRLVQGPSGELYRLNSETGIVRLDATAAVIVPPGRVRLTDTREPRYNSIATVYVGLQNEGGNWSGRPLLDTAFDGQYVYVVPVVVNPDGGEPYTAAAKLRLVGGGAPPYEVVRLYDDPPLVNDNQYRNGLRELELDAAGNLYVLNVHALNESDILWKYAPDGTQIRLDLGRPDGGSYIPAPVAMFASRTSELLYLASATPAPAHPDSAIVYGFSTKGAMALEKRIRIEGLQHVTCMAEDSDTGTLWAAGFNMYDIPMYPNPTQQAFYYPGVAGIPSGANQAQCISVYDPGVHDLALPMSLLWLRPRVLSAPSGRSHAL